MAAPVIGTFLEAQQALDAAYKRVEQLEAEVQRLVTRLAAAGIA